MRDLLARADAFEKEPGINVVSIQAGFMPSDISNVGPSVAVSYEPGAEKRAQEIARQTPQVSGTVERERSVGRNGTIGSICVRDLVQQHRGLALAWKSGE